MTTKLECTEQPAPSYGESVWLRPLGHTHPESPEEEPLVAEHAQRSPHGVCAHAQFGCEVSGWRQSLARQRFALVDRTADLRRDLLGDDRHHSSIAIHVTPVSQT
jgi:hypothetical protein